MSNPTWVTFTDEETGRKVHLNIVLFHSLQPGRELGYVREAIVINPMPEISAPPPGQDSDKAELILDPEFDVTKEPA